MKFIIVIGDGMSDYPVEELGGKTPLQVARHPHMDKIVSKGVCGSLKTIPEGMEVVTGVAVLSILGYDPRIYYLGRGPLEAASMGIALEQGDIAFRCNLITERDGILQDYSADHIETTQGRELISKINETLGVPNEIQFFGGISYRHLLVLRSNAYSNEVKCVPPHDVMGRPINELMVFPINHGARRTASLINEMMMQSREILSKHPINLERQKKGKNPGNMIWPWGPGMKLHYPSFMEQYSMSGAVISAVDVIKGLGLTMGMEVIDVPGATGYFDTNYEGKGEFALRSLKDHDFVLVHVEAPDEAGHIGDFDLKIKAIEDLDERLLGNILEKIDDDFTIAILADHPTPISVKTHTSDAVPFAFFSTIQKKSRGIEHFNEESVKRGSLEIEVGHEFFPLFLRYGRGQESLGF